METLNIVLWTTGVAAPIFYAAGSMRVLGRCWGWLTRKLTGKMNDAGLK